MENEPSNEDMGSLTPQQPEEPSTKGLAIPHVKQATANSKTDPPVEADHLYNTREADSDGFVSLAVKGGHNNDEGLKDKAGNVEAVKDKHDKIEHVKYECGNSENVKDKHSNIEDVEDKQSNTDDVKHIYGKVEGEVDKHSNTEGVGDIHSNVEGVEDKPSKGEGVRDIHSNVEGVEDKHSNTEGVKDIHNNVEGVEDKQSNTEDVKHIYSNVEGVEHKHSNTEGVRDIHSNVEGVEDKHSNTEGVKHIHSNVAGVEDKHSNTEGVRDIHSNVEDVEDKHSNTEGVKDIHSNIEGVEDKHSNTEGVKDIHSNIESVEDKQSNTEGIKDNRCNVEGAEDKHSKIEGVKVIQDEIEDAKDKHNKVEDEEQNKVEGTALKGQKVHKVDVVDLTLTDGSDFETETNKKGLDRNDDEESLTFPSSSTLFSHMTVRRRHSGYKCPNCTYSSLDTDKVVKHMVEHHVSVTHVSGVVYSIVNQIRNLPDYGCISERDLNHQQSQSRVLDQSNSLPQVDVKQEVTDYAYKCPNCDYNALDMDAVLQHMVQYHVKVHQRDGNTRSAQSIGGTSDSKTSPYSSLKLKRAAKNGTANDSTFSKRAKGAQNPELQWCKCTGCDYKTSDKDELVQHMIQTHVKVEHNTETEVDEKFDTSIKYKSELQSPKKSVNTAAYLYDSKRQMYKCSKCEFTSMFKSSLQNHMEQHPSSVYVKEEPSRHVKLTNNSDVSVHNCSECDFKAGTVTELVTHMKTKHDFIDEWQPCTQCEYVSRGFSDLIEHVAKMHSSSVKREPESCVDLTQPVTSAQMYRCPKCAYTSATRANLCAHIDRRHRLVGKIFKCNKCDYKTKLKQNLVTHSQRTHTTLTYRCRSCDYVTKWLMALKAHTASKHPGNKAVFT